MQSYGPGAGLIGALSVWPSDGPYSLCLGPSWLLAGPKCARVYIVRQHACLHCEDACRMCTPKGQKMVRFLELCVSSLRRGHANLLCIVPNFVNVFGFPLGRVLGESADMYTSDVIAQAVRGPIISEV